MDIKLDDNGDIDLENGEMTLTDGLEAVRQRLKQRYQFIFQEWFLNQSRGIPYAQQVFVKGPSPVIIDAIFKSETLSEPSVLELQKFELDLDTQTRALTITLRAITADGPLDFKEVFDL